MRSGSSGQTSAKRAMAASAAALGVDVGREALAEQRHARAGRPAPASGRRRSGTRPRSTAAAPGGRRARRRRRAARSSSVKPMSIVPVPRLAAPGQAGNSGRPSSRTMTFTTGPAWRQPVGAVDAGQRARCARGRRWRAPRARATSSPSASDDAGGARRPSTQRPARPAPRCAPRAPAASAAARSAAGHRAHAAARVAPRAGRARPPRRGRGRSRRTRCPGPRAPASVPIRPWMRERHPHLLGRDAGQVVGDRARRGSPGRSPPASARGRRGSSISGRARVGRVVPALRPGGVAVGVGRRPVALELRVGALAARPGDDLAPVGERREQVGLVDLDLSPWRGAGRARSMISRAQQRQRVGAGRGAHARPQLLGHAGAADDVAPLEHLDVEARRGPGRRRRPGRCGRRR